MKLLAMKFPKRFTIELAIRAGARGLYE